MERMRSGKFLGVSVSICWSTDNDKVSSSVCVCCFTLILDIITVMNVLTIANSITLDASPQASES